MEEILQNLLASDFADLAGLAADATIPLSQSLINELIAAALEGEKTIRSCLVRVHDQNRVSVQLKTALLPWALDLKLKLDRSVDFASYASPKMRMWLENNRWLGSLGALFNALPAWAKLYGDQLVIDLGFFFRAPEQKELLALFKSVEIRTEEGRAVFDVKIRAG